MLKRFANLFVQPAKIVDLQILKRIKFTYYIDGHPLAGMNEQKKIRNCNEHLEWL